LLLIYLFVKITQIQHLSGARLVELRAPALLKWWTLNNVITLTLDDSRNTGDDSRNSMDVLRMCANRTLRKSSVNPSRQMPNCRHCVYSIHFNNVLLSHLEMCLAASIT